ncbi:MAG TPA: amidase family protein [Polyangia bacterium]|nr:amidase family protein [Polyangia bacterium]
MRVAVARAFAADRDVTAAFDAAVEVIRANGHQVSDSPERFAMPPFGDVRSIEADRRTIARGPFETVDVLLLPTTTTTVPTVEDARADAQKLSAANTLFANYFGLPAVSVPCGFDRHGLPIGLQLVAKAGDDGQVLQLAHQYQIAAGLPRRHPPLA